MRIVSGYISPLLSIWRLAPVSKGLNSIFVGWFIVLFSGCTASIAVERPTDLASVSISEGGAFSGGTSSTLYSDGTLISASWDAFSEPVFNQAQLPPENFQRAWAVADQTIRDLPQCNHALCEDFGSMMIVVNDPFEQINLSAFADCPDPNFNAAIRKVAGAMFAPH